MSSSGSVTHWIQLLQAGEDSAARAIWERYFRRLVGLARAKLRGARCGIGDEEDVALSVLDSFYRGLEEGRFPNLENRDNLWKVLVVITARKSLRLLQREHGNGRGPQVLSEADMPTPGGGSGKRCLMKLWAGNRAPRLPPRLPTSSTTC